MDIFYKLTNVTVIELILLRETASARARRWRVLAQEKLKGPILQWAGPSIVPSRPSFVLPSTASLQPSLVLMALIVWLRALGQYFFFFLFFFWNSLWSIFRIQTNLFGNVKLCFGNSFCFLFSKTCFGEY